MDGLEPYRNIFHTSAAKLTLDTQPAGDPVLPPSSRNGAEGRAKFIKALPDGKFDIRVVVIDFTDGP